MAAVTLHEGDCLEVLPALGAGSVDAVVTDPPYGQTNEAYDSPVAFDPAVWRECYRVAAANAALVAFAGSPTYHRIAGAIEAAGWRVRQMWAWVYRNGLITSAYPREGFDRLAPAMDPIVFATKGKVLLRLEREGEPWSKSDQSGWSEKRIELSGRSGGRKTLKASGRWPRTVVADGSVAAFDYFALSPNSPKTRCEKTGHPNQKPLALMRWLVAKLPGTVLDPFAGSGTTAVACVEEGRDCILIERDPGYCAVARRRVAEAQARFPLFAPPTS